MQTTVKISQGGRLSIPASFRKKFNLQDGSYVILETESSGFRVLSMQEMISRIQKMAEPYLKGAPSLADELIRERREEVKKEQEKSK